MGVDTRMGKMHSLELKHEAAVHQANMIARDEEARRHRLRALALQDEKAALQEQLSQKNTHVDTLMAKYEQLENELRHSQETNRKQEAQIKGQARDLTMLQTELQSLSNVSQDSAKVLGEKLALSREVNMLKPEIEHLKSQLAHQQSAVAEKLALERQLNSIEVELEAEKRARQRALQREVGDDQDELRAKVQELERKLAAERKDKERVRKEGEKAVSEATARTESLKERLDSMKTKLRDSRDELKRCQAELNEARSASTTFSDLTADKSMAISVPAARKQGKKRRAEEMTAEISIGTPGAADQMAKRPAKKRGFEPTLVGEKSNFSITPFLNKTKVIEDMSPNAGGDQVDEAVARELGKSDGENNGSKTHKVFQFTAGSVPERTQAEEAPVAGKKQKATSKARGRPRKVLGEVSSAKKNTMASPAPSTKSVTKKARAGDLTKTLNIDSGLESVVEEVEKEETKENEGASGVEEAKKPPGKKPQGTQTSSNSSAAAISEPKTKKRKLLGGANSTLFDDEDVAEPAAAPAVKRSSKVQLGASRGLMMRTAAPLVKKDAFAGKTFSPLKRDRRGIHASFLA